MGSHNTKKRPDIKTKPMIGMYQKGLTTTQIAEKLGVFKTTVRLRLIKAGITLRKSSDYTREKRYWLWKGEDHLDLKHRKYNQRLLRKWSKAIKERDGYKCQDCSKTDVRLHAHHLIPLMECINTSLEFDIKNGVTLCIPCHRKRHTTA